MPLLIAAALVAVAAGVWLFMSDRARIAEQELAAGVVSPVGQRFAAGAKYKIEGDSPDTLPWCGMFARYCSDKALRPLPGNQWLLPSVNELEAALADAGKLLPPTETPQRGDLILLRGVGLGDPDLLGIGDRHVGVVVNVDADFVYSIDGDYGVPDGVRSVRRSLGQANISGYGRV